MNNRRILRNYRLPIVVAGCVLVASVVTFAIQQSTLAAKNRQVMQLAEQCTRLQNVAAQLPITKQKLDELRHRSDALGGEQMSVGQLLQRLGQDMIDCGAADRQVRTGNVTTIQKWNRMPISISFSGTFQAAEKFIERIEAYPMMIRPEHVALVRDTQADTGDGQMLQVKIELAAITPKELTEGN